MLITFDLYGTLLNTTPIEDAVAEVGRSAGIDPILATTAFSSWEDRLMYGGRFIAFEPLLVDALRRCDTDLRTDGVFAGAADHLFSVFERLVPFPDVVPALHRLKAMGMRLGTASNTSRYLLDCHLRALDEVMDLSVCADELKAYKPREAVFAHVASWRTVGEHHAHVAKGYWWDVEPARRLGWHVVWVNRDGLQVPDQAGAIPQLPTLEGLPSLLKAIDDPA